MNTFHFIGLVGGAGAPELTGLAERGQEDCGAAAVASNELRVEGEEEEKAGLIVTQ